MALHKRHTHGRVFAGVEAREHLAMHRRDSHGSDIKMNVPEGFAVENKDAVVTATADATATAVSVIYVTLPQTFSGAAVYSTLTGATDAVPTANVQATGSSDSNAGVNAAAFSSSQTTAVAFPVATSSSNFAASSAAVTSSFAVNSLAASSVHSSSLPTASSVKSVQDGTDGSNASSSSSSGMSGGAMAGLAFGIIAAFALVAGLAFFCWRRRKNPSGHEELIDEKHTSFVDASAKSMESRMQNEKAADSLRSTSTAPRLSLRPVTQFLPNLGSNDAAAARPTGNTLEVAGAAKSGSAWERRPSNGNTANPFEDATAPAEKSRARSPNANPFEEMNEKTAPGPAAAAPIVPSGPSSAANTPKSSMDAGVSAAGAAAPARGPNNVHRVQLDFKPSMEDELELRSGQLVRMLHEYDDGWALCIRMDRSQQGVAPRTCLSKLPVKPRPQGPAPPNGQRPRSPPQQSQQQKSRPSSPSSPADGAVAAAAAPIQPPNIAAAMYPRPLTPTQGNRDRSQSNAAPASTPSSPPRKPIPGQAM